MVLRVVCGFFMAFKVLLLDVLGKSAAAVVTANCGELFYLPPIKPWMFVVHLHVRIILCLVYPPSVATIPKLPRIHYTAEQT